MIFSLSRSNADLVDRARASFKTKFGSMGLRDRGLRLAGYLTPPSDLAQEDDDNAERYNSKHIFSRIIIRLLNSISLFFHFAAVEWCPHWRKSNRAKCGHHLHLSHQRRPR